MPPRTVVIVFTLPGCGHCSEFLPRFKARAARVVGQVPIHVVNADAPQHTALAERLGVTATPAMYVLRHPTGMLKLEGAVTDAEIDALLSVALAYR